MAITASFLADAGVLTVLGDSLDNTITASRDAAGRLLLNGGDVVIQGGQPTVANTSLIQVFGQGGADIIAIDEASGALPSANLFGGDGNDTLTGGSAADQLFGQSGNDILNGKGGDDFLFGGDGDDTLTGGGGTDQLFGEAGNDRIIWNPGDGSDVAEGGDGVDTLEVNGGNGAETFTITANGTRVSVDRAVPAPFHIDAGTIENIVINANGGDDTITAGNGLAGLISLTIDGGAGNDRITGGDGNDQLFGGDGNDFIDGNRGNDVAHLGTGDDVFQWDPGDGSDVVEGEAGVDTLLFNGANLDEKVDISASGDRVLFSRDPANITMDLHGVEHISFNALGGADNITVNNLAGTDVTHVAIDLAGVLGGSAGDAQVDTVNVNATASDDVVSVVGSGGTVTVSGLAAEVTIDHAETTDVLVINGLDGNDVIDAAGLTATAMALVANGGAGNDRIIGGGGNDQLFGGDGNDFIDGNGGNDVAHLGTGDDVFQWDPGDGSDVVEGEAGVDTLLFNGANLGEKINISANGDRALFSRDIAGITMDLHGVEHISFNALGGADNITVNNLAGTGVTHVAIDLAGVLGGSAGDTQVDNGERQRHSLRRCRVSRRERRYRDGERPRRTGDDRSCRNHRRPGHQRSRRQ